MRVLKQVLYQQGQTFVEDVPAPRVEPGSLLVRVDQFQNFLFPRVDHREFLSLSVIVRSVASARRGSRGLGFGSRRSTFDRAPTAGSGFLGTAAA